MARADEMRYMEDMAKAPTSSTVTVRDAKTGRLVKVRGAGSLSGSKFAIRKNVDLTKPIANQVLKGSSRTTKRAAEG